MRKYITEAALAAALVATGAWGVLAQARAVQAPQQRPDTELGTGTVSYWHTRVTNYGNEGRLVLAPRLGYDPRQVRYPEPSVASMAFADYRLGPRNLGEGNPPGGQMRHPEPSVASMAFADYRLAREIVVEANANGEQMCMADLGAQPGWRGQRWWVFTC